MSVTGFVERYLVVEEGVLELGDVEAHPRPVGAVDDDRAQLPGSVRERGL